MDDVKIKVIDSNKLINAINEGSYDINLSAVMALGAVMLDCIDRQDDFEKQIHAMFDHIWDCEIDHPVFQDTVGDLMGAVIQCHKGLPSAQPEQRWIPVTERLPEDKQPVIFSTKTGRVHQGKYYKDGSVNQWYSALDKMRAFNNVVNAWMPLPEPYEERRQK